MYLNFSLFVLFHFLLKVQLNAPEGLYTETGLNQEMDAINKRSVTYEKVVSTAPPSHLPVSIEDFKKMKMINNLRLMPNSVNTGSINWKFGILSVRARFSLLSSPLEHSSNVNLWASDQFFDEVCSQYLQGKSLNSAPCTLTFDLNI